LIGANEDAAEALISNVLFASAFVRYVCAAAVSVSSALESMPSICRRSGWSSVVCRDRWTTS
jgi:hypothetical protein